MTEKITPKSQTGFLPYAWVILVIAFMASVASPLNQAKIPLLIPLIMDDFQLSIG